MACAAERAGSAAVPIGAVLGAAVAESYLSEAPSELGYTTDGSPKTAPPISVREVKREKRNDRVGRLAR